MISFALRAAILSAEEANETARVRHACQRRCGYRLAALKPFAGL